MRLWLGRVLIPLLALAALTPWVQSWMALSAGVLTALTVGNPFAKHTAKLAKWSLQAAVIGLGFGMNLVVVVRVGAHGFGYTLFGLATAIGTGMALRKLLGVSRDVGILVSVGTAICGGSAIAAVAPAIGAKAEDTTVSLAVVFLLNAVGLLVFPPLGHVIGLDETQFGLWAALAIHDTSSVVGAAAQYGPHALETATTIKLARALWIVPVALVASRWSSTPGVRAKQLPWFILGFLAAAALATFVPAVPGATIASLARHLFASTLFLIGAGLSKEALKVVGAKPLALGVMLWAIVATASLGAILAGLIG